MEQSFLGLVDIDTLENQSLEEHVVEQTLEDGLISLPRSDNRLSDPPTHCLHHGSIELDHRVVVRLDDLYLLFGLLNHANYTILEFISFG